MYICNDCPRKCNKERKALADNGKGFCNMGENPVINGKISLDDKYSSFEIFGASANLIGDKLILNGMLAPYSAFAVVLKK